MVRLSLPAAQLSDYVCQQLLHFFPDGSDPRPGVLASMERTIQRLDACFSRIKGKYFQDRGEAVFEHRHTDQYAMFLYLLCNTAHEAGDDVLASKVYALNKALHAIDVWYEVALPEVFLFAHAVGSVLGRASYSDYLCVYHGCTVGSDLGGTYPRLERGVILFGGSSVIGQSTLGPNCWVSINTSIVRSTVPGNSIVSGASPNLQFRTTTRNVIRDIFDDGSDAPLGITEH